MTEQDRGELPGKISRRVINEPVYGKLPLPVASADELPLRFISTPVEGVSIPIYADPRILSDDALVLVRDEIRRIIQNHITDQEIRAKRVRETIR